MSKQAAISKRNGPVKKTDLYASLRASCDELRGGMDAEYAELTEADIKTLVVEDKWLARRQLAACEVTLPTTTEEQTAIATVLADMDTEIEALDARLAKTRALKAGMMQQLLTGRIRLPLEDAA